MQPRFPMLSTATYGSEFTGLTRIMYTLLPWHINVLSLFASRHRLLDIVHELGVNGVPEGPHRGDTASHDMGLILLARSFE
jgi:hypothetical protein